MNADEVIERYKALPADQREKVQAYVRLNLESGQLPGEQLGEIAQKMYDAKDPAEVKRYEDEFIRGFYGDAPHA